MAFPIQAPAECSNHILAALDKEDYAELFSRLEKVSLIQGKVVYEAESEIQYVYFPETAVLSILATMEDGRTVEVGPAGKEGLVGLRIFLGAETTLDRVIVHIEGTAQRLPANVLRQLVSGETALSQKLMRYTQMLLAMTGRSAACNQLHDLDQQLARWLLTLSDYVGGNELKLTHELIALTLGVRRAGVTEALNVLKNRGVIATRRNTIRVLKREGLQSASYECYGLIREEYENLYADLASLD